MSVIEKMREDKKIKKETDYEKAGKNDTSQIEKLTDDCLIEIFQHLTTIADKIRIERVCKRWQSASQRSWNNFKSLDFSAKTWGMEEYRHDQRLIRSIDFDKIIMLSGRYLTSISTDVGKFIKICHLLPNILRLHLIDDCLDKNKKCHAKLRVLPIRRYIWETTSQCTFDIWQGVLLWLITHCENMTNFKMTVSHSHYKEEDLISLLGKMKQLKSFSLYNCHYLDWSGTFVLELPLELIREIILTNISIHNFDIYILSTLIQKCKKLQTLGLDIERCKEPGIFELLPSHAASLKNLKQDLINIWSRQWKSVSFSELCAIMHLEKLDVSYCYFLVNDQFLERIVKNCKKLTHLNLLGCHKITDRGISSICSLKNLTYLGIRQLPEIRNPPLKKLKTLVVLDSSGSAYLQEKCLCTFLKRAHQLRALDVRSIHSVSHKLLKAALETAQIRKPNNALDLYVDGVTEIDMFVLDKKPPFLNIIHRDSKPVPLVKYGIEHPFNIEKPEVHMH